MNQVGGQRLAIPIRAQIHRMCPVHLLRHNKVLPAQATRCLLNTQITFYRHQDNQENARDTFHLMLRSQWLLLPVASVE